MGKRKRNWKILYIFLGILLGGSVFFGLNQPIRNQVVKTVMGYKQPENTCILVVGQDSVKPLRSDTIILVCMNVHSGEIMLYSVPRDSRLEVSENGFDKINHSYARGGIKLLKGTLEKNLGLTIPYTVETDYQGFEVVIDTLGGVEIDVEKPMKYIDKAQDLNIDIPAGKQRLSGQKALQYVRFRNDKLGDIGRIKRQQKFLEAMLNEMDNPLHLPKIPQIMEQLRQALVTNIPGDEIVNLALWFKGLKQRMVSMEMMAGEPVYIEGVSYWEPHLDASRQMIHDFFTKEKKQGEQ
ncbi:MAG: LCP family protein [Candidatus Atribacteria bacterium]|nr:LCP family protein [Candidatus Atribacteria bacterium]